MKKIIALLVLAAIFRCKAQENYCDFEGMKKIHFAEWNGVLDTAKANPNPNAVNMSATCAKYIRDTALYDNIKFFPFNKLSDVSAYASTSPSAPKMSMKIYCSAAPGTSISIQLGSRTSTAYPAGIHSEYAGVTVLQNSWQTITFNYVSSPPGGFASSTDINKIVVLFHPNSHARDTIYFDDPTGPPTIPVSIQEYDPVPARIFQNKPNPANDNTSVKLQVNNSGFISLRIYDVLGKPVSILAEGDMYSGTYNLPVNTAHLPGGIYFYVLKADGVTQSRRMIIAK